MLIYVVISWIIGIVIASWGHHVDAISPIIVAAGLIVAVLLRRDRFAIRFGLCLVAAGVGIWRYSAAQPQFTKSDLAYYNDQGTYDLVGIVVDQPDVRDTTVQLRVEVQSIKTVKSLSQSSKGAGLPVHGLVLLSADRNGGYAYGDKLSIRGDPLTPPDFDTFSYGGFLARSGVYTVMALPRLGILDRGQGNSLLAALYNLKDRSHDLIGRLLPAPGASVMSAILLGERHDIPADLINAFNATGTSHVITVSGSNLAVFAGILMFAFGRFLPRRSAALITVFGMVLFVIFVGAGASVVRAAIVSTIGVIAGRLGRRSDALTALATAIWVITLVNPNSLFDLALILGSAATLGLILYSGPLTAVAERLITRLFGAQTAQRLIGIVADTVLITIAAQLTTLPLIALFFGQFSPSSFLVNALVGPAQGLIMLLGLLMLVTGAILFPAGQVIAWLASLPLLYTLAVIRAVAQWPGAVSSVTPDISLIIGYYVILGAVTLFLSQPLEVRQKLLGQIKIAGMVTPILIMLGVGVAALLWLLVVSRPDGKLHLWFLNVGDGNAVLIQTPTGAHFLIDGGQNPTQLQTALGDRLPFFDRTLDVLFLTQPKRTTVSAVPGVLERFKVRTVISNGQLPNDETTHVLSAAIQQSGAKTVAVTAGYSLSSNDGVTIDVLSPGVVPYPDDKVDDDAMILRLTYGQASFLLTSNLSPNAVKGILDGGPALNAYVLEVPSNGSEKVNTAAWLQAIDPQVAVIRAVAGATTAQPADAVLQLLKDIPVYRTDQNGTIEIASDGNQLFVSTERQH